ncbi:MAG: hypothetical protein HFH08_03560 [Bacilli bacterium]|nr:hypothetical protein [Bacilli bacterium]
MKKEEKKILNIVKRLKGNVLIIGIENETILKAIEENSNIYKCNLMNAVTNSSKENEGKTKRKKNFQIKKLRKKFHKKKVDNILCNMNDIYPYLKTFVKDSVYINRGKLYFYGEKGKYDLEKMIQKYKKYHAKVEQNFEGNYFFLTISNEHSKTSKIKDIWFSICEFMINLYETIGDMLIN